jgi:choice-of-anchor B domain-containing protein
MIIMFQNLKFLSSTSQYYPMKKYLVLLLVAALTTPVFAQYSHNNISLLSQFDDPSVLEESVYHIRYQGCWGWKNPADGREYAIIGSTFGTYFVEVTDPANPVQRAYVAGTHQYCIWHEYKSYGKYCYILSDDSPNNSFQIADMSYLPDSVHIVYDGTSLFVHGHAEYIDGDKLYVSSTHGTSGQNHTMAVFSLANPELPVFLRALEQDYPGISAVHDMYVVNDTVYASASYQGMQIYKYNSSTNHFIQIGSLPGLSNDYNHSSFLSEDHKTLYMCIEVPSGRPVHVVDVSNISSPIVVDTFITNTGATPHNPYVIGNTLVLAAYADGVYAYNITDTHSPSLSGYFDSHPQNGSTYPSPVCGCHYAGCWGAFTDLPSGILLTSDMQKGLFVLDKSLAIGITENNIGNLNLIVYPNPSKGIINVQVNGIAESVQVSVSTLDGKTVYESSFISSVMNTYQIDTRNFAAGLYMVKAVSAKQTVTRRISVIK